MSILTQNDDGGSKMGCAMRIVMKLFIYAPHDGQDDLTYTFTNL